jgi:hypothetical protein
LKLLGSDYRYWLAFNRGHEAAALIYSCVFDQVGELVRDPNPWRVPYVLDPRLIDVDLESGLDLRFDSAYWVSAIVARDPNNLATVDARSSAVPRNEVILERIEVTRDNFEQGADLCGANPDVQTGEAWRERSVVRTQGDPIPTSNNLFVTLVNVATVAVDLTRARMKTNEPGTIDLSTDGNVSTTLTGFPAGKEVTVNDASVLAADENGQVNVELSLGSHRLTW